MALGRNARIARLFVSCVFAIIAVSVAIREHRRVQHAVGRIASWCHELPADLHALRPTTTAQRIGAGYELGRRIAMCAFVRGDEATAMELLGRFDADLQQWRESADGSTRFEQARADLEDVARQVDELSLPFFIQDYPE